jgi:hypothetical protein
MLVVLATPSKGLSKINFAIACYTPGTLMLEVCRWN